MLAGAIEAVDLVETSPVMQELQRNALAPYGLDVRWWDQIDQVPSSEISP
jgi:SAM-dependent MidA family methyltransferase